MLYLCTCFGFGQGGLKVKYDGNDDHHVDNKTTAGWPAGARGVSRKARIGGGGGGGVGSIVGGSGSDKRRVRASMERLWRVYEVVMKRDLQLKGSVGIFNKVLRTYDMYSYLVRRNLLRTGL